MTDNEIIRSYNEAANKTKQIGILADLTQRKIFDIVHLLGENGAQLPDKYGSVEQPKTEYAKYSWSNEREAKLLALKEKGLTWAQIADEIGGTANSVSVHYCKMQKPKHRTTTYINASQRYVQNISSSSMSFSQRSPIIRVIFDSMSFRNEIGSCFNILRANRLSLSVVHISAQNSDDMVHLFSFSS